jgi:GTPase
VNKILTAIIADVILPVPSSSDPQDHREQKSLELNELRHLVETYGGIVVERVVQQRRRPSAKTYLGTGKANEVKTLVTETGADILIINGFLKPQQMENLSKLFHNKKTNKCSIHVWDRTDIILKIFEKHAKTQEAKLQIKLARLKHEIPKAYQYEAKLFDKERGGISGTRGAGEKGIEMEKRHIRAQIKQLEKKLEHVRKTQEGQRKRRRRSGLKTIALVGYTNAGKSTLLRSLTTKDIYIADELFATLDTRLGSLWLPSHSDHRDITPPPDKGETDDMPKADDQRGPGGIFVHHNVSSKATEGSGGNLGQQEASNHSSQGQKVLLADTIGFIQNLPPHLIESFKTTLSEVQEADLLLHIIDASDPEMEMKTATVETILTDLNTHNTPVIKVYNKTEALPKARMRILAKDGSIISALKKEGLRELKSVISTKI